MRAKRQLSLDEVGLWTAFRARSYPGGAPFSPGGTCKDTAPPEPSSLWDQERFDDRARRLGSYRVYRALHIHGHAPNANQADVCRTEWENRVRLSMLYGDEWELIDGAKGSRAHRVGISLSGGGSGARASPPASSRGSTGWAFSSAPGTSARSPEVAGPRPGSCSTTTTGSCSSPARRTFTTWRSTATSW